MAAVVLVYMLHPCIKFKTHFILIHRYSLNIYLYYYYILGLGSSLILSHSDQIIPQYFRLKYESINSVLQVGRTFGFIITPAALGNYAVKIGLLQTITWYQAVVLWGLIVSLVLKKPKLLKDNKQKYNIIEVSVPHSQ